jgi:hypothetical protein
VQCCRRILTFLEEYIASIIITFALKMETYVSPKH